MYFAEILKIYESLGMLIIGIIVNFVLDKRTNFHKKDVRFSFYENILFAIQFFFISWGGISIIIKLYWYIS